MKLIGLMVCRNEAWVLPASLPAALQWVDKLVVLNHRSTDSTASILQNEPGVVQLHCDREEWDEAADRNTVLDAGRKLGGTHFAMIDADELLTAPGVMYVRNEARKLQPGQLLRLPWIHCWRSLAHYRCDPSPFGNARVPFIFCDSPAVRYEAGDGGYQFHRRVPLGTAPLEVWDRDSGMGVLHLQHANWMRVVAKQKRYADDELRRWGKVRANYAAATDETGLELKPLPRDWWPIDPNVIDLKATAWQAEA